VCFNENEIIKSKINTGLPYQAGNNKQQMPEFRQENNAGGQDEWNVSTFVISL
jgi:hypothetical protein